MDQLEQRVNEFFSNAKKNKPEWREEQMEVIKKVEDKRCNFLPSANKTSGRNNSLVPKQLALFTILRMNLCAPFAFILLFCLVLLQFIFFVCLFLHRYTIFINVILLQLFPMEWFNRNDFSDLLSLRTIIKRWKMQMKKSS